MRFMASRSCIRVCLLLGFLAAVFFSGCSLMKFYEGQIIGSLGRRGIKEYKAKLSTGMIRYFSGGHGFPIVFIHGFGGDAAQTWRHQLKLFSKDYRVLAPDIYWFGESLPDPAHSITSPAEQADAIAELMDKQGIGKAHIAGVSFGGYIALRFAMRHPTKTATLSVVDAAGLAPTPEEERLVLEAFSYAKGDLPKLLIPETTEHLKLFLEKVSYKPYKVPGFMLESVLREIFWKNKDARTRIAQFLRKNFITLDELKALRMPTTVFWGEHDPLLRYSMGRRMAQAIPKATFIGFHKSAHMPMLEQPNEFNQAFAAFLSAHNP